MSSSDTSSMHHMSYGCVRVEINRFLILFSLNGTVKAFDCVNNQLDSVTLADSSSENHHRKLYEVRNMINYLE